METQNRKRSLSQSGDTFPSVTSPPSSKRRLLNSSVEESSASIVPKPSKIIPSINGVVRIYFDGVFDLFHYGHMRALKNAKKMFPQTYLIVGVISDKETLKYSGKTVLTETERMEAVSNCTWVDHVVSSSWIVTPSFLKTYSIDILIHGPDDEPSVKTGLRNSILSRFPSQAALQTNNLKTQYICLERTEGISTSIIISRIVRDFDGYVLRNLSKGVDRKDMNISLFTEKVMKAENTVKNVSKNLKMINDLQNFKVNKILTEWQENRVTNFLSNFGGKWLSSWSNLGFMKKISIFRKQKGIVQYPHSSEDEAAVEEEEVEDPQLFKRAFNACTSVISPWSNISESQFKVTVVRGGLTNQLYKCSLRRSILSPPQSPPSSPPLLSTANSSSSNANVSLNSSLSSFASDNRTLSSLVDRTKPEKPVKQVLMRIYGAHTDIFFDKEKENLIFQYCSDCGFGPKLFGFFEGGRLEEFIIAQTLQLHHLPIFSTDIGKKLAFMHHMELSSLPKQPSLFDSLYSWLDAVRGLDLSNLKPSDRELFQTKLPPVEELMIELGSLQEKLKQVDSPIVFCHNDLQEGNILYDRENDVLRFIDFEYGNYNFRGFDFGNHFCEWQFSYAVTEYPFFSVVSAFPTKSQQRNFLKGYLDSHQKILLEKRGNQQSPDESEDKIEELDEEYELEKMYVETCKFSLASHFLWGLWGILQASSSEIEFGFLEYSMARFTEYFKMKDLFFSLKSPQPKRKSKPFITTVI